MSVKVSLEQVVQQLTEALVDAEKTLPTQRRPIVVIRQQVLVYARQHNQQQMP
jgi:hypothetical protein